MGDEKKDDVLEPISEDIYALVEREKSAESLASLTPEAHKAELARDTDGLRWRCPLLKVNHSGGTFNFEELGKKEHSPDTVKMQVIQFASNRALWRPDQGGDDQLPVCSSTDCINGSVILPNGSPISCSKCGYGRWWDPADLLHMAKKEPVCQSVLNFVNEHLAKSSRTVEGLASEKVRSNIAPPCKESRRIFAMIYDDKNQGVGNQPIILSIPPTSIKVWDKYRQDVSLRKERMEDGTFTALTLITVITQARLSKTVRGGQVFSLFDFQVDAIATKEMISHCFKIRDVVGKEVMSFEMSMDEFDPSAMEDPTALPSVQDGDVEVGEVIELDDEGEDII